MASTSYTNFCMRSGGSNLNAGTRTGDTTEPGTAADLTYASGTFVRATGVFTVASGDPSADGVAVGDYVSIYTNGQTLFGLVGRVTARDTTTITINTTAIHGALTNVSETALGSTLKVGGAWGHPGAAGSVAARVSDKAQNASGHTVRVNIKNDASPTGVAAFSFTLAGSMWTVIEGYSSTYGDGGIFTATYAADGSLNGSASRHFKNLKFIGSTSVFNDDGLSLGGGGAGSIAENVSVASFGGRGFLLGLHDIAINCEAYDCNKSNKDGYGGFFTDSAVCTFVNCTSHDNGGANSFGFGGAIGGDDVTCINCIADSNGGHGFAFSIVGVTQVSVHLFGCDTYNNGGSGVNIRGAFAAVWKLGIVNSNFVKNGAYGVEISSSAYTRAVIHNCGFGAGTQANTSGKVNYSTDTSAIESNIVDYASDVTPWNDPANGDFSITLAAAKGAGYGSFFEQTASYGGTVGYPDIGAAQHLESAGGGTTIILNRHGIKTGGQL